MSERIILDIRKLQRNSAFWRPADRVFGDIIRNIPLSVRQSRNIQLYADPVLPLPQGVADLGFDIVRGIKNRREAVLLIELSDDVPGRSRKVQQPLQDGVRVLALSDQGAVTQDDRDEKDSAQQLIGLHLQSSAGGVGDGLPDATIKMPVVLDETLRASCDALDEAALALLFPEGEVVLAVDGALGADKDIMRAILGLTRRREARIVVCGEASAVEAPKVSVLRPSSALLGQIARRAAVFFVPAKGGAQALSLPEVRQLGGRCVAVDEVLQAHHLDELMAEPISAVQSLSDPDYAPFWDYVLKALPTVSVTKPVERPRIALVTPMFPQKGGPPHSSLDLALALTEISQLDIWTDADMLPAHRARMNAVYRLDSDFEPDRYDEVVYVLGNHPMYLKIFDMMCEYGGTLILHDAQMLDFLNLRYGSKRLSAMLSQEQGVAIDASDPGKIIGKLADYGRPFLHEILRYADTTIVHSPIAAKVIRHLYGVDVNYFPVAMPYPFKASELTPQARSQAKMTLGISTSRPCIASFGEVHMLKGAKQCLFVMRELLDWGIDFQFLFVGPIEEQLANEMRAKIEQYGLKDYVFIKGAVSEADYIQYLTAVDIVLQIRQIPFGQVSGALLDSVSAGMHGVASENLARSIEAPPLIRRVNDKASPTIYAEQLAEMIATKCYEDRPGPGWEGFSVKHDFHRYARNLLSMLFGKQDEK